LRTARGAGRLEPPRAGMRVLPLLVRGAGLLLVLRDRVLEDLLPPPLAAVERDVLEFRDPGGEDVRVAMSWTLRESHTSPMDHRKRVASRPARRAGSRSKVVGPRHRCNENILWDASAVTFTRLW
jgi:hypothetical protein